MSDFLCNLKISRTDGFGAASTAIREQGLSGAMEVLKAKFSEYEDSPNPKMWSFIDGFMNKLALEEPHDRLLEGIRDE